MTGAPIPVATLDSFPHEWAAEVLTSPPMIAPVRAFIYPQQIAGEEDSLARGALQALVRSASGGAFLATFALGFTDSSMPTGLFSCPNPEQLCALAGGYAYLVDTTHPDPATATATLLPLKPVTAIHALPRHNLLLFSGFHSLTAWGPAGIAWQSQRLSYEGLHLTSVQGDTLHGTGWNLLTDRDLPFALNLLTGEHTGGGFTPPQSPGTQRS